MGEMSEEIEQKMDAERLRKVAEFLFPGAGRSWKSKVAVAIRVHVTTVRRWVNANSVPGGFDQALEGLCVINQLRATIKQLRANK